MEMQEGAGLFKGVVSEKGGQLGVNRGHCRVWAGGVVVGASGGVPGLIDFTLVTAQVGSLIICLALWKDSHI